MGTLTSGDRNSGMPVDADRQSYLAAALHVAFDPVNEWVTGQERLSDEFTDYARGFVKALPLFMKGRLALTGLILSYAADEAKIKDGAVDQLKDAGLGVSKGLLLKGSFSMLASRGATPGMSGVGTGMMARVTDGALTRSNYLDAKGEVNFQKGLSITVKQALNPTALAVDAITYGAADVLWARTLNWSRGSAWYRPEVTHAISGGAMGASSEFGIELHRQLTTDGKVNVNDLVRRSLLRGAFDSVAGGLGGWQSRRISTLHPRNSEGTEAYRSARSTPFQRGETVDRLQGELRDGKFLVEKRLPELTTETWVGWTRTPDGKFVRSIFRPDNGSDSFARRMQSEIAAYGLQTLGFKMNVPVTVARKVEVNGKSYSGYMQELDGISLANYLKESAANGTQLSRKNVLKTREDNGSFRESYENAFLHRMLIGEWDNHALNMTVSRKDGSAAVRNIDLGDSFRPANTTFDLLPTPGVRQGYDKANTYLYGALSGKKLDTSTLSYLQEMHGRFSTPTGRQELGAIGLTPLQTEGLLGRIDWFVKAKQMPAAREPLLYLELNKARRAMEHWLGHRKSKQVDDQTNYYQRTPNA